MEKFAGRFYVSTLIVTAAMDAAYKGMQGPWHYWVAVVIHLLCLALVIKDGVE